MILVEKESNLSFLVDTGAVYSVIPHQSTAPATGPALTNANGKPIPCWGSIRRSVSIGGRQFTWNFLQAGVAFPILGADFLAEFNLLVDLRGRQLIDGSTGTSSPRSRAVIGGGCLGVTCWSSFATKVGG